ncbi:hypothetical protein D3C77_816500 [compost metagenome]
MASASIRRTRLGTNWAPKMGMTINSEAMRNSGSRKLASQPPICSLVSSSMGPSR